MERTHYFQSLSDAADFCESHKTATNKGDGVVAIECDSRDELDYWIGCEELGPFPHDTHDFR